MERLVAALDRRVDALFGRARGRAGWDALFAALSGLGDFGFVWALIGVWRIRRRPDLWRHTLWAISFTGVAVPAVNYSVKVRVGRRRPAGSEVGGDGPVPVRRSASASFPSGHSAAATCAAILLSDGDAWAPVYAVLAFAIASSRVYTRSHHASDVVAGAVEGAALARIGRMAGQLVAPVP